MTQPWCEQQRIALRAFRKAIAIRSEREHAITAEEQRRRQGTAEHYAAEKERVESAFTHAQSEALAQAEQTRTALEQRQQKERRDLKREYVSLKQEITGEYSANKETLEAEFREARWSTHSIYDADKRVAKEAYFEAQSKCKGQLRKQLGHWQTGRKLIDGWDFLDDIPPLDPK